jgi:hypothetical protein
MWFLKKESNYCSDILHLSDTGEKHQLLYILRRPMTLIRRGLFYNIFIKFVISMKLYRLVKNVSK